MHDFHDLQRHHHDHQQHHHHHEQQPPAATSTTVHGIAQYCARLILFAREIALALRITRNNIPRLPNARQRSVFCLCGCSVLYMHLTRYMHMELRQLL